MTDRLSVWWADQLVGAIVLNAYGEPEFAYSDNWLGAADARAISASLPLRHEPFDRRATLPFFEGLLPEAAQRTNVAQLLGVSERNEFRLLEQLGAEVAGALSILPESFAAPTVITHEAPTPLSDDEIIDLIEGLPARPMLAGGEDGLRLSLAGAQSKLPVVLADGRIALPSSGQPTTHILKPEIARFDGSSENEAYCMTLARIIGLDVPPATYHMVDETRFLLVERYDRAINDDGSIIRLHQEDFCQALGLTSAQKYAREGGPTFRQSFDLVRRVTSQPAREVLKLLDAAIFNAVIGNADAHGKNFSFLYWSDGLQLAPFYDLLSTTAYPELSQRYAMKIGNKSTLDELYGADWINFAEDISMRAPFVRRRVSQIAHAIIASAETALDDLDLSDDRRQIAKSYKDRIEMRAKLCLTRL